MSRRGVLFLNRPRFTVIYSSNSLTLLVLRVCTPYLLILFLTSVLHHDTSTFFIIFKDLDYTKGPLYMYIRFIYFLVYLYVCTSYDRKHILCFFFYVLSYCYLICLTNQDSKLTSSLSFSHSLDSYRKHLKTKNLRTSIKFINFHFKFSFLVPFLGFSLCFINYHKVYLLFCKFN